MTSKIHSMFALLCVVSVIKTGSGGVCCHNARGRVRTGSPIPRPLGWGIGRTVRTSPSASDNKPRQIGLNHDYNVIFSISPVTVSNLYLKSEYGARSKSRFACYSHCSDFSEIQQFILGLIRREWSQNLIRKLKTETAYHTCCRNVCFTWWRHQMETFFALLALCAGNSPVTGEFTAKSQWCGALVFSLICAWISRWVNTREAGDLRRHRAHYDVIVMNLTNSLFQTTDHTPCKEPYQLLIRTSAVMTRPNTTWYCIQYSSYWDSI